MEKCKCVILHSVEDKVYCTYSVMHIHTVHNNPSGFLAYASALCRENPDTDCILSTQCVGLFWVYSVVCCLCCHCRSALHFSPCLSHTPEEPHINESLYWCPVCCYQAKVGYILQSSQETAGQIQLSQKQMT